MNGNSASIHSTVLEKILEHLFIGELLRVLWMEGFRDISVLRGEVDSSGYDVVLECNRIVRHVQLKGRRKGGSTREVPVNKNLENKKGGCVIWCEYDPNTLAFTQFLWFGGAPEEAIRLGDRPAKHSRANSLGVKAVRPNIRVLKDADFKQRFTTINEVAKVLFGTT